MGRAPCCEKVGLKKGRWTTEEDEILKNYIQTHGEGSWRSLPKNAGLLRCGKSCRLRWINYLRSDLKRGNITPEEEDIIVELHTTMGNRWSLIAGHLPERTDNEIKNYWNSHLSRKIHFFKKPVVNTYTTSNQTTTDSYKTVATTTVLPPPKRRGCGRTSRAAMKKNRESFIGYKNKCMMEKESNMIMHGANYSNVVTTTSPKINPGAVLESDTNSGTEILVVSSSPCDFVAQELLLYNHDDQVGGLVGPGSDIMSCFNDVMQMDDPHGHVAAHESCSNAGSATSSSDRLDWEWDPQLDYDQLWMGMEEDGSTGSEKEQIISLLWENDDDTGFKESTVVQSGKEVEDDSEAMVAWLMS